MSSWALSDNWSRRRGRVQRPVPGHLAGARAGGSIARRQCPNGMDRVGQNNHSVYMKRTARPRLNLDDIAWGAYEMLG